MQFYPCLNLKIEKSQGGQVASGHLAMHRRYCSLDGVLESCQGEGASAGYGVWTPRCCLGGGGRPRSQSKAGLWATRAEMEQMGHLRTKCVLAGGGLWSQQRRWHVLWIRLRGDHPALSQGALCTSWGAAHTACLCVSSNVHIPHPSPKINSLKASPDLIHLCTPFPAYTQSLAQCLASSHSNKCLFDGLWKHDTPWFPIGSNKTWSETLLNCIN